MKGVIVSLVSVGTAAAQITLGPAINNIAAVNINDPAYSTCSVVANFVGSCYTKAGGANADASKILGCACCVSSTAVYPLYSACSTYLSVEGGTTYKDTYSAYSVLYSACGANGQCKVNAAATSAVGSSAAASSAAVTSQAASATITASGSSAATQTYAQACLDMLGVFTSCTSKISDFTSLGNRDQASCYCCQTSAGSVYWTDAMDAFASTCANWAKTGEPKTVYPLATTIATFCEHFSDVCNTATGTVSAASGATATDTSATATGGSNSLAPTTITVGSSATATTKSGAAPVSVRVGCGAVLAAIAAFAIAL